jgi:hypothetical protein
VIAGNLGDRGTMDIKRILAELHADRQNINQAITALEHVGGRKRRGRPPKWMSKTAPEKGSLAERNKRRSGKVYRSRELEPSSSPN